MAKKKMKEDRVVGVFPEGKKWVVRYYVGNARRRRGFSSREDAVVHMGNLERQFAGEEGGSDGVVYKETLKGEVNKVLNRSISLAYEEPSDSDLESACDPVKWLALLYRSALHLLQSAMESDVVEDKRKAVDTIAKSASSAAQQMRHIQQVSDEDVATAMTERTTEELIEAAKAVVSSESGGKRQLSIVCDE
ncbi:MAG: hypothetical protein QNJ16_21390 [Rhodobacter sp.]|nr:hypothetical protein [Rhodobacter sp.]